jgi:hypothetical protein
MMSVNLAGFSHKAAPGWWRLDPRVVAHLRARTRPLFDLWAAAPAMAQRSASGDDSPTAFAPTQWPDTEWSDTRSDFEP